MITEDYCDFETARLLKEKGFNEKCCRTYFHDGIISRIFDDKDEIYNENLLPSVVAAPTLQMAMKWLREMYDIHVVPKKDFFNGSYTGMIYDGRRENVFDKDDYIALIGFDTYEQSCEKAIKYCLENLI